MHIHQILLNIIFEYLEFYDKHIFKRINKYANKIRIIDLYNIDFRYLRDLDNKILMNYSDAIKLNADCNSNITNVNHMTKLKESGAQYSCGIDDKYKKSKFRKIRCNT